MFLLHCFFANVLAQAVHALSLFALDKLEAAPPSNFVVVPACLLVCFSVDGTSERHGAGLNQPTNLLLHRSKTKLQVIDISFVVFR
jgi:hypothetical protein